MREATPQPYGVKWVPMTHKHHTHQLPTLDSCTALCYHGTMNNTTHPTTCPRCDHEAYDTACDDYEAQPCCGWITGVDQLADPDEHFDTCKNAPSWMTDDS